nr:hypothetical protein BaRGS_004658 [Batillaria attramentaria]
MFQDLNSGISSTQFLRPAGSNGQTISYPTGEKGRLIPIPGADTTCPTKVQVDENASVASRSLCPFYNDILVMPEGYYPPTFLYAKCKCTDCIENDAYGGAGVAEW